jgi:phage baseplate assembly protein gpV
MLGKRLIHKTTSLALMLTIWCAYSMVAFAAPKDSTAEITTTGQVTVNGQLVTSGATIVSGSIIATAAGSTATVSLGKAGRIEIAENSEMNLKFTDASITGILNSGKARIAENAGVATTITTKDGVAIADAGQANTFAVEVECSHSHVDTVSGMVTMRTGANDKQVAAGTDAVAGNLTQTGCKPCLRPGTPVPLPVSGIGNGGVAAIVAAVAGGVAAAVFFGLRDNDIDNVGGTINVVSPLR